MLSSWRSSNWRARRLFRDCTQRDVSKFDRSALRLQRDRTALLAEIRRVVDEVPVHLHPHLITETGDLHLVPLAERLLGTRDEILVPAVLDVCCLLYTSDAADE